MSVPSKQTTFDNLRAIINDQRDRAKKSADQMAEHALARVADAEHAVTTAERAATSMHEVERALYTDLENQAKEQHPSLAGPPRPRTPSAPVTPLRGDRPRIDEGEIERKIGGAT